MKSSLAPGLAAAVVGTLWVIACSESSGSTGPGQGGIGMGGAPVATGAAVLQGPSSAQASGCAIPAAPDLGTLAPRTVGDGTAASCTEAALQAALDLGGRIDLDCGKAATSLRVTKTLTVKTHTHIQGKGLVTLDGGEAQRILKTESNTRVILEGLTFVNGHSTNDGPDTDGSGGAVYRGWQAELYVKDCVFRNNLAEGGQGVLWGGDLRWFGGGPHHRGEPLRGQSLGERWCYPYRALEPHHRE